MARSDDELVPIPRSSYAPEISGLQQLDGSWYGLRFVFSARDRRWYMDVTSGDGTTLVTGLRVACGVSLLGHLQDARLPAGQLFAEDASGLGQAPGRDAWQGRATLYYRPAAVVEAARGTDDEVF